MWKTYRRKGVAEMRPYVPGEDLTGISVSAPDVPIVATRLHEMLRTMPTSSMLILNISRSILKRLMPL